MRTRIAGIHLDYYDCGTGDLGDDSEHEHHRDWNDGHDWADRHDRHDAKFNHAHADNDSAADRRHATSGALTPSCSHRAPEYSNRVPFALLYIPSCAIWAQTTTTHRHVPHRCGRYERTALAGTPVAGI